MNESKTVLISDAQFKHFRSQCGNRGNWTDGGHWMGFGKEPNCSLKQNYRKKSKIIVKWPTESSAKRWNDDFAQAQRNLGYAGTGLATLGLWYGKIGQRIVAALVANLGIDILKGESIAAIPHPEAKPGWKMVTELDFHFQRSVYPAKKDVLRVTKKIILFDKNNQQNVYSGPQTTVLVIKEHLEELVDRIFGQPGSITTFSY